MVIRRSADRKEILANDGCRLRELFHPAHDPVQIDYSLAVARVEPGKATLPHRLTGQSELYFVLSGSGRLHSAGEVADLSAGDSALIPVGAEQWIECLGQETLEILLVVAPPWNAEDDVRTSA